jgi:hypothetical protein
MEDLNKKLSITLQTQEHSNFEKEDTIKYSTDSENTESETTARNEQRVQKCTLSSEGKVGCSYTAGKQNTDEQNMPNSANNSTEKLHKSQRKIASNSSDINNSNSNVHKRNTGNTEMPKQSEQEFVIHREHCENLENNESSEDVRIANQQDSKSSLHGLKSKLSHEPVDLLIKDSTQTTTTKGLYNFNILMSCHSFETFTYFISKYNSIKENTKGK